MRACVRDHLGWNPLEEGDDARMDRYWFVCSSALAFACWSYQQACNNRRRQSRELVVSRIAGFAIGSMLLGCQSIVHPRVKHAVVEEQEEDRLDSADSEEPPGGHEFHAGLRRIRAGHDVDDLRVRIEPKWRVK